MEKSFPSGCWRFELIKPSGKNDPYLLRTRLALREDVHVANGTSREPANGIPSRDVSPQQTRKCRTIGSLIATIDRRGAAILTFQWGRGFISSFSLVIDETQESNGDRRF